MSEKVLIDGAFGDSDSCGSFYAENPATAQPIPAEFPISSRGEVDRVVQAAARVVDRLSNAPGSQIGDFLEAYASGIESRSHDLAAIANLETGLPVAPRLKDVEIPRTVDQLRQAAIAAREGSWRRPVRDIGRKIYSGFAPLGGPVVVIGPNNFPFAYNSIAGGDFAAAIAAHNPVIAKANPGHPGTTSSLAEIAMRALSQSGLPLASVQLIYHVAPEVGRELVADPRIGATAFTGSRQSGLSLKDAADLAGRPIYLEMGSINPVVLLEGALLDRAAGIAQEFFSSCTMASGQFCTNPGLLIVPQSVAGDVFVEAAAAKFGASEAGVLLGKGVNQNADRGLQNLVASGATTLAAGTVVGPGRRFPNSLLTVAGEAFLDSPEAFQSEVFGPVSLIVRTKNLDESAAVLRALEGNLTGTIYSGSGDEEAYSLLEPILRTKVGRLINDRMPTGVAVSPAMNHGGPYPAAGHPGFTAVGFPASIARFAALHCYDNVPDERLPAWLRG